MSGGTKRKVRDAEKRQERLHWMFIVNYVKGLHSKVYTEAEEFYQKVKSRNPRVKDLTKTAEFMGTVMPGAAIPRHYTSKKRSHLISPQPQTEMVLNIPLLPQSITQPLLSRVSTSPPPEVSTSSFELSPEVYEELLNQLKSDPELWKILNNFPFEENTDDINNLVAEDMGDTFRADDLTPLELELEDINNLVAEDMRDTFGADDLTPLEHELEALFQSIA